MKSSQMKRIYLFAIVVLLAFAAVYLYGHLKNVPDPPAPDQIETRLSDTVARLNQAINRLQDSLDIAAASMDSVVASVDIMLPGEVVRYVYVEITDSGSREPEPQIHDSLVCYTYNQNASIAKRLKEREVLQLEVRILTSMKDTFELRDSFQLARIDNFKNVADNCMRDLAVCEQKRKRGRFVWAISGYLAGTATSLLRRR